MKPSVLSQDTDSDLFVTRARAYIEHALPHAPRAEKQKLFDDWMKKEEAAEGIVEDFRRRVGDVAGKKVLDVGFGNGVTLSVFAKHGGVLAGVEVSPELFNIAREIISQRGVVADLRLYGGRELPFGDETFEYAYSVSVLEHTSNPAMLLKEVYRVLKPGGKLYLAFPNRWFPKETHTGIWFLSYLPRGAARGLLSLFERNTIDDWNLHFLSYFSLCRILRKSHVPFSIVFEDSRGSGIKKVFKKNLARYGIHHSALLPHIMVILRKP